MKTHRFVSTGLTRNLNARAKIADQGTPKTKKQFLGIPPPVGDEAVSFHTV